VVCPTLPQHARFLHLGSLSYGCHVDSIQTGSPSARAAVAAMLPKTLTAKNICWPDGRRRELHRHVAEMQDEISRQGHGGLQSRSEHHDTDTAPLSKRLREEERDGVALFQTDSAEGGREALVRAAQNLAQVFYRTRSTTDHAAAAECSAEQGDTDVRHGSVRRHPHAGEGSGRQHRQTVPTFVGKGFDGAAMDATDATCSKDGLREQPERSSNSFVHDEEHCDAPSWNRSARSAATQQTGAWSGHMRSSCIDCIVVYQGTEYN
jgi:hypothetical protein